MKKKMDISKAKARKILDNHVKEWGFPIFETIVYSETKIDKLGRMESYEYTFRGLLKYVYELKEIQDGH